MCDDRDKHFSSVHRHKTLSPSSRFVTQYSLAECAESAFSKAALCLSGLAGCIFDGVACQKCFCVTLDKSNRTEGEQVYEIGGVYNAKNDKRNGG